MNKEMSVHNADPMDQNARGKPRLAFMGEFSSGKSTLSKLLLGDAPLPVRVTATRFPPVWVSHGEQGATMVGHDGSETPLAIEDLASVRIEDARLIRLRSMSETLEICDLIDMPGISDPSMAADTWQSVLDEIDSVVWCTQATQAWRQTEAAAWQDMQPRTNGDNILLVTQIDKLRSDRDVERVLKRVRKETEGVFKAVYPLSILKAIEAGDDVAKWRDSGAAEFIGHLVDLLLNPSPRPAVAPEEAQVTETENQLAAAEPAAEEVVAPEAPAAEAPAETPAIAVSGVTDMQSRVLPKRVRVHTRMRGRVERPDFTLSPERRETS